ncbi:hypothetical protein L209DRAFT_585816 [Thermothelomyces heterothallicus CBS 203.75]
MGTGHSCLQKTYRIQARSARPLGSALLSNGSCRREQRASPPKPVGCRLGSVLSHCSKETRRSTRTWALHLDSLPSAISTSLNRKRGNLLPAGLSWKSILFQLLNPAFSSVVYVSLWTSPPPHTCMIRVDFLSQPCLRFYRTPMPAKKKDGLALRGVTRLDAEKQRRARSGCGGSGPSPGAACESDGEDDPFSMTRSGFTVTLNTRRVRTHV